MMQYNRLGECGLVVSELALGLLPMGPLQKDLSVEEGAAVIEQALAGGVTFIDTAQSYRTYPHLAAALQRVSQPVVVATKSGATDYAGMHYAIEEARRELNRDVIDIFHLHAAKVDQTVFQERAPALRCLVDAKRAGIIGAIGIATHAIEVVEAASRREDIDVVFPVINVAGLGVLGGSAAQMAKAIALCAAAGQGVYVMKALGGGNLVDRYDEALRFARQLPGVKAVAMGMVSLAEADFNLAYFQGTLPAEVDYTALAERKQLMVAHFCIGCGECLEHCPAQALALTGPDNRCQVSSEHCLLCGYCAPYCPQFALRVV